MSDRTQAALLDCLAAIASRATTLLARALVLADSHRRQVDDLEDMLGGHLDPARRKT